MSLSIFMENSLHNAAGCLTISIRITCLCHAVVLIFISQQLLGFLIYNLFISTNELDSTCLHGLRAFRGITEYQNRLPQSRSLLLNSTGVSENHISSVHKVGKRLIVQRINEINLIVAP